MFLQRTKAIIVTLIILCFTNSQALCLTTNLAKTKTIYRASCSNINWWDNFSDPYLKNYIYTALEKNREIRQASIRSEEYREMVKIQMAKEFPNLMFLPSYARIKTPKNQILDIETSAIRSNIYILPLFSTYEADIFLKNHNKTDSKRKDYEAKQYEEKALSISVAADIAALYINIIKLDKTISTQEKINKLRKEILSLTKERNLAGLVSVYDVTYSDKLHTQSQIELNDLKRQRSIMLHQFAVYIDDCQMKEEDIKRGDFDEFEYKGEIPECISSQIVIMRPDIMKAEAELKRAKIDTTIARKEFLPNIPIFGTAGYNALLLKDLFNWENILGIVGISFMQKIYSGGELSANLRLKKLKYEELFEAYKQADISAIQEINDSLSKIKFDTKKDNENNKKINLEIKNFKLVQERYKAGIISYLEMIQFSENLLSLQKDKYNSKAQRLADYISLYKATGGGWN